MLAEAEFAPNELAARYSRFLAQAWEKDAWDTKDYLLELLVLQKCDRNQLALKGYQDLRKGPRYDPVNHLWHHDLTTDMYRTENQLLCMMVSNLFWI
jgi:hypothetical protein